VSVFSYKRFSSLEQLHGDSLRRQTDAAAEWAAEKGLTIDETLSLTDFGVSTFRGRNAKQGALGAFLKAVEMGRVKVGDYLLLESLDRLSRAGVRAGMRILEQILVS
jgi:DNA invertase Pin-like site-specific DNA recombinase